MRRARFRGHGALRRVGLRNDAATYARCRRRPSRGARVARWHARAVRDYPGSARLNQGSRDRVKRATEPTTNRVTDLSPLGCAWQSGQCPCGLWSGLSPAVPSPASVNAAPERSGTVPPPIRAGSGCRIGTNAPVSRGKRQGDDDTIAIRPSRHSPARRSARSRSSRSGSTSVCWRPARSRPRKKRSCWSTPVAASTSTTTRDIVDGDAWLLLSGRSHAPSAFRPPDHRPFASGAVAPGPVGRPVVGRERPRRVAGADDLLRSSIRAARALADRHAGEAEQAPIASTVAAASPDGARVAVARRDDDAVTGPARLPHPQHLADVGRWPRDESWSSEAGMRSAAVLAAGRTGKAGVARPSAHWRTAGSCADGASGYQRRSGTLG